MPITEERIDAIERDNAEIKRDLREVKSHVREVRSQQTLQTQVLTRYLEDITELRTGQDELRTNYQELRKGQDELRSNYQELRKGQDELRTNYQELRTMVERNTETLAEFRSAFNIVLDELQAQKAWREEFSSKVAWLMAKAEGVTN
ncbi:coiled-coil domain-containing protein [Sphaerimonospora thailandensis]|uniref:Uncharacterized protein n=1 Tax=Sphaerimonospora thailandensis TaxID=795644 RepID=A0A8J3R3U4_9ACTN|nr:hypothetical protein [Sphaerimonospora thailandensis]GIH68726.1 hypothetical protein Mth01_09790 [Sphaerimonospora thailandensis]